MAPKVPWLAKLRLRYLRKARQRRRQRWLNAVLNGNSHLAIQLNTLLREYDERIAALLDQIAVSLEA